MPPAPLSPLPGLVGPVGLGGSARDRSVSILVVEDDENIAMGLEMNLSAEGYAVRIARHGDEGLDLARAEAFDLVILDIMLPRRNGYEVLRALRASRVATPVILLSARGAEMDKVMGLELGAEDYIIKPFGLAELLARIKVVLRRGARERPPEVVAGELSIRPSTREVLRGGAPVDLTATEFDVLWCLAGAQGRVLSREQIQQHVWGSNHHGTPRTVDNFLLQLRQKLESDPQRPRHLLTVRGVGYRFAG